MPTKILELKAKLRHAGFLERPAKGSHSVWTHQPTGTSVTLAGQDGRDAKPYQVRQVQRALARVRKSS